MKRPRSGIPEERNIPCPHKVTQMLVMAFCVL